MSLIYTQGKVAFLNGQINLHNNTTEIYAALVKNTYNESPSHVYTDVSSHIAGTLNSAFVLLSGCTVNSTSGVFSAANPTFNSVASGSTVEGVLFYHDTGSIKTVIAYIMPGSSGGFPFPTNGANVVVSFDSNGIFSL